MAVTPINSQEGLLNFRGFHGSKSSSLLQLNKRLHFFSCVLKCFSTFSIYQIDNIPCWNPKYVIHVGQAFRDTSLSNVWQLVASLRKKVWATTTRSSIGGSITRLFLNLSQTIFFSSAKLCPTINAASWLLQHISGKTFSPWNCEFQQSFSWLWKYIESE